MEEFKMYLSALSESSKRTRSIVYFLLLTCVVVFSAIRRSSSYITGMDVREANAIQAMKLENAPRRTPEDDRFLSEYKSKNPYYESPLSRIDAIEQEREKSRTLTMPIVGISFDESDLPVFSGIVLSFLLTLLYFSMGRELRNFQAVRDVIPKLFQSPDEQKIARDLIALDQVLNIAAEDPRRPWYTFRPNPAWLLIVPVVTQIITTCGFTYSYRRGSSVNNLTGLDEGVRNLISANIWMILVLSWAFLFAVLWTSALCWKMSGQLSTQIEPEDSSLLLGKQPAPAPEPA